MVERSMTFSVDSNISCPDLEPGKLIFSTYGLSLATLIRRWAYNNENLKYFASSICAFAYSSPIHLDGEELTCW